MGERPSTRSAREITSTRRGSQSFGVSAVTGTASSASGGSAGAAATASRAGRERGAGSRVVGGGGAGGGAGVGLGRLGVRGVDRPGARRGGVEERAPPLARHD